VKFGTADQVFAMVNNKNDHVTVSGLQRMLMYLLQKKAITKYNEQLRWWHTCATSPILLTKRMRQVFNENVTI